MTAWLALSLTVQNRYQRLCLGYFHAPDRGVHDIPFPFDHFFFCFFPPAAGACKISLAWVFDIAVFRYVKSLALLWRDCALGLVFKGMRHTILSDMCD